MKKLLNILAITGLVATSASTVVACGNKKDNKEEDDEQLVDIPQLIIDFKQEVYKIVTEHIKSRKDELLVYIENEGDLKYKFFNKKNLEKIWKNSEEKTKLIEENWKSDILDDLNKILDINNPITGLETKINKLVNDEKYSIILSNLPNEKVFNEVKLMKDITFDNNKGEGDLYIANVRLDYEISVWFKGLAGELEEYEPNVGEFKMTISSHKEFLKAIKELSDSIKKDFASNKNEGSKWSNIRYDDLKPNEKTQVEDLTEEIEEYKNSKDHSQLTDFMENQYFTNLEELNIQNFSFKEKSNFKVTNPKWDINFRKDNKFETELQPVGENSEKKLQDGFFNPNQSSAKALDLIYRYDYSKGEGKKELREFGNTHFKSINDKFEIELQEFLKKQVEGLGLENSAFDGTKDKLTRMTTIKIPEIEIHIGKSYVHPIPNQIDLIIGYTPSDSPRDGEKTKELYIENIANAIAQFQNTYDIIAGERNKDKYEAFGKMKKGSELLKKWQSNNGLSLSRGVRNKMHKMYPLINLTSDKLIDVRRDLLAKSKQQDFDYSLGGKTDKNWTMIGREGRHVELDIANLKVEGEKANIFEYWFEIDYFKIKLTYDWQNGQANDHPKLMAPFY